MMSLMKWNLKMLLLQKPVSLYHLVKQMRYYYLTLLTVVLDLSKLVIVTVVIVVIVVTVVIVETAVKFVNSVTVEYSW